MSSAIPQLSAGTKSKVIGGVLFGSTRATIAGFPNESWASYCAADDKICKSKSGSTGSHLSYSGNGDVQKAIAFLSKKIDGAKSK